MSIGSLAITVIAGLVAGSGGAIIAAWATRPKTRADAVKEIGEAWGDLFDEYRAKVEIAEAKADECARHREEDAGILAAIQRRLAALERWVRSHGGNPDEIAEANSNGR